MVSPTAPSEQVVRSFFYGFIFLISVFLFVPAAILIYRWYPAADPAAPRVFNDWVRALLAPEGAERLTYVLGLLYFLLVPAALARWLEGHYVCFREFCLRSYASHPGRCTAFVSFLVVLWLALAAGGAVFKFKFQLIAIAGVLISFWAARRAAVINRINFRVQLRPAVYAGWITVFLLLLSCLLIITDSVFLKYLSIRDNFNVILGTVNQVVHGRTVLVDVTSQYGILYPYLAAAALKAFGTSISTVSLLFAALSFLSLAFLALAVSRALGFSLLSFCLCFAIVGSAHPFIYAAVLNKDPYLLAPYYAYLPIRVLFGTFMLYFSKVYLDSPSVKKYLAGAAIAGLAVIWNIDTGVVVALSWLALLAFQSFSQKPLSVRLLFKLAGHLLVIAFFAAVAAALYGFYAKARSGAFPDWGQASRYQAVFYSTGFMMLRMKLLALWQLPILVYLLAIYKSMRRLLGGSTSADDRWQFFVAVYGLGIFSYYQGRSHIFCLTAVVYPAVLLASLWAYRLISSSGTAGEAAWGDAGQRLRRGALALLVLPLLIGFIAFSWRMPAYMDGLLSRAGENNIARKLNGPISFLKSIPESDRPLIIAHNAETIYLLAGRASPLPVASLGEIILKEDLEELQGFIDRGAFGTIIVGEGANSLTFPLVQNLNLLNYKKAAFIDGFSVYSLKK